MIEKTPDNKAVTPSGKTKAPAKKKAAKKAPPKKQPAKVGPSNVKGASKKAPPKKTAVPKKAPLKKVAPAPLPPKKATPKKATPKKATPKKATPKKTAATKAATKTVEKPKGLQVGAVTFRSNSMFRKMYDNLALAKGKKLPIEAVFQGAVLARDPLRMIRLLAQKGRDAGAFDVLQHPDRTISMKKFKAAA